MYASLDTKWDWIYSGLQQRGKPMLLSPFGLPQPGDSFCWSWKRSMQVCYLWLANTLKRVRRLLGNKETEAQSIASRIQCLSSCCWLYTVVEFSLSPARYLQKMTQIMKVIIISIMLLWHLCELFLNKEGAVYYWLRERDWWIQLEDSSCINSSFQQRT